MTAWTFLVLAALCVLAYVFRQPLLLGAGKLWIVDEPVPQADAVVVLGGSLQLRSFAAAELFARGLTTNVLIAHVKPEPPDKLAVLSRESDAMRGLLMKQGVPDHCISLIGTNVGSTYDEALALRHWALEHRPKVVIIPTELFHTRRVNWLMEKQLRALGVDVRVVALDPQEYNRTNWWQHEPGVIAFRSEVLKYLLYRCRY